MPEQRVTIIVESQGRESLRRTHQVAKPQDGEGKGEWIANALADQRHPPAEPKYGEIRFMAAAGSSTRVQVASNDSLEAIVRKCETALAASRGRQSSGTSGNGLSSAPSTGGSTMEATSPSRRPMTTGRCR